MKKTIKAWAVVYRKDFLTKVSPASLRFGDCCGAIAIFRTKKKAGYYNQHPVLQTIPCTITYSLPQMRMERVVNEV